MENCKNCKEEICKEMLTDQISSSKQRFQKELVLQKNNLVYACIGFKGEEFKHKNNQYHAVSPLKFQRENTYSFSTCVHFHIKSGILPVKLLLLILLYHIQEQNEFLCKFKIQMICEFKSARKSCLHISEFFQLGKCLRQLSGQLIRRYNTARQNKNWKMNNKIQ